MTTWPLFDVEHEHLPALISSRSLDGSLRSSCVRVERNVETRRGAAAVGAFLVAGPCPRLRFTLVTFAAPRQIAVESRGTMNDTAQRRIEALARDFVDRLQEIARDELFAVLGGTPSGRSSSNKSSKPTRGANSRGAKRDPAALEQLGDQFVAYVTKHPGLRIEQINAELGSSTKELALPIRKLLAAKAIRSEGSKRSTKYFPGGSVKRGGSRARKKSKR